MSVTLWIYDPGSREVVAQITGPDNAACEAVALERWSDTDSFGWTYSPAFDTNDGLLQRGDRERVTA